MVQGIIAKQSQPSHALVQKLYASMTYRGQAQNGELGYGPNGKKSSANPDKVYALEGVHTHQVACGIGHTLFLVKPGSKQVSSPADCEIVNHSHLIYLTMSHACPFMSMAAKGTMAVAAQEWLVA